MSTLEQPAVEVDGDRLMAFVFRAVDQVGATLNTAMVAAQFRSGEGFGWHEHSNDGHEGCARFFEPGYKANLVGSWLPALDSVVEKGGCEVSSRS